MGSRSRCFTLWTVTVLVLFIVLAGCQRSATKPEATSTPIKEQTVGETPEQTMNTPTQVQPTATPEKTTETSVQTTEEAATVEPTVELTEETTAPEEETQDESIPVAEQTYTISEGDTLFSIATAHGLTVEELTARNNINDADSIEVGQEIIIPVPGSEQAEIGTETDTVSQEGVHIVQVGENLFRIALKYDLSFETVAAYNNIPWPYYIYPGQEILIPPE
ncbi:MAG: LysM peptidoglycan-binding domain-containing protein [Anaerolineales bacterium]|nr:LysM peptidoglycan-binding domain-containing protein [Anaerolineales bacterium]